MVETKWLGAPLALVIASWFVDYTLLALTVLLLAATWLLCHMTGVMVRGSLRLERGHEPALGRLCATVTLVRRDPPVHG